ncbi:MAG: sugar ABC transporter substrate-binding protein [Calditrichaeota bacterium]|nr:MAG: sugar ABC transporter substrate-binding protein [Calditrichota bacterium]
MMSTRRRKEEKQMNIHKILQLIGRLSLLVFLVGCDDLVEGYVDQKPENVKTITITMVAKSSANPVFRSAQIGAEAAAKALTEKYSALEVKINWRTPVKENANLQAERIRNAVEDGTDAILVSCSDTDTLTHVINDAVNRGTPVMTFDSDAPDSKRFAFYGVNDVELGENLMNEIAKLIGAKGQIAILGGNALAPNLQKRIQGIKNRAANYPDIEIVTIAHHDETVEEAVATVLSVNSKFPELKGWAMVGGWAFFDEMLLDKLTPGDLKIVAVDALPVQLPYIEMGIVQAFLGQPTFKWGKVSVESIVGKLFLNKNVKEFNQMKPIRVSKDNLGGWSRQLRAWGYKDVPGKYLTW